MGCANGTKRWSCQLLAVAGGGLGSTAVPTTGSHGRGNRRSFGGTGAGGCGRAARRTSTLPQVASNRSRLRSPGYHLLHPRNRAPDAFDFRLFRLPRVPRRRLCLEPGVRASSVGHLCYPTTVPACGTGTVSAYPLTQTVPTELEHPGTVGCPIRTGLWWECNTGLPRPPPPMQMRAPFDASAYGEYPFIISGSIGPVSTGTGSVGLAMAVSTRVRRT